jgi:hypothetical protein
VSSPADWYPDPSGRHEVRYWDGGAWTEHVSDRGAPGRDPVDGGGPSQTLQSDRIARATGGSTDGERSGSAATSERRTEQPARPTPIISRAGWTRRTKAVATFVLLDATITAIVIWLVTR